MANDPRMLKMATGDNGQLLVLSGLRPIVTVYSPSGASTCELQGGEWGSLYPVVQQGRLITFASGSQGGLVAFDAPGFEAEAHGWITHRGSYARNGRAR